MDTLEEVPAIEDIESKVQERLEVFVRAYVSEFERYTEEAEVGDGVIGKSGKIADTLVGAAAGTYLLGGPGASIGKVVGENVTAIVTAKNLKKAKRRTQIFQTWKTDERRKMLVEAASLIYHSFQTQFGSVTDAGLSKLAIDACKRSISYLHNEATEPISKDLLTKAVILGESEDSLISHVIPKKIQKIIPETKPGHTVICKGKEWKTSDIYEKVGIKIVGSNGRLKYYKKKMCGNDYGYRWAFNWENDSSCMSTYEEDYSNVSEDTRTSLNIEELEPKTVQILANINKEDPKLQLTSIKDGVDEDRMQQDLHDIKTKLSIGLPQCDEPKIFTVKEPVKTFTGRERELTLLHDKLQTQQNQVVVSQCASISGLGGMGKSELARKYAHTYHECYRSCIWIDSETQSSITQSFNRLAEKLQIPITQKISDSEKLVERNILLIVKDIYKRFSRSKTLFIFDNVNQYEEIKDYLPLNLSTDEKPTIIITSRNSDWDIGDEGDVGLILLDQFTPEDALSFVKKVLEIKDEDTSHDTLISELTKELCCFPLALRQAASYIKTKKFLNSGIENYLVEFCDEKKKKDLLKYQRQCDPYTETTYTTWQVTFKNMERGEANGPLAIRLVEVMAYLPADNIPLKGFIELAENKEKLNEAVDILLKYSIITANNDDEESYLNDGHVANIHRLVQQVIRLWLQQKKGEKKVLRTALTQIYDAVPEQHRAALWSFACMYKTLIKNCLCIKSKKTKSYDYLMYVLNDLVKDGDTRTIRKILNYFEGRNDWREASSHLLNVGFVECNHNDLNMESAAHEEHIKDLILFHAEVFKALKHSNTKDLELFLQNFDKSLMNSWFENCTALERSARSGKVNVVKILVEHGADVDLPDRFYGSTRHIALTITHPQIAEYMLTRARSRIERNQHE